MFAEFAFQYLKEQNHLQMVIIKRPRYLNNLHCKSGLILLVKHFKYLIKYHSSLNTHCRNT